MKVLVDLDGVLVDYIKGVCLLHGRPDIIENYPKNNYNVSKILGLSAEAFWAPQGFDFWANLGWTEYGPAIWETVRSMDYCILTSPCETAGCADGKIAWIRKNIPDAFKEKRYLIGPAKAFCAAPTHVLIDDLEKNCVEFTWAGGHAILCPARTNMLHRLEDQAAERVDNMLTLYRATL